MKIAVTTASGALGSVIIKNLVREIGKEHVVGLARTPEKAQFLGVEIRKGDYSNGDELKDSLAGIDAILLVSGNDQPQKRIQQHRNVIEAAKANGVKKIVYTSVEGDEESGFNEVVKSNRQTEEDVKNSGLEWVIGRNNIYIEPDLEYIDNYVENGGITNSAGEGKCAYTSRNELGYAYARLLTSSQFDNGIYHLCGEPITQNELARTINLVFGSHLTYRPLSVEDYLKERQEELGEFLGAIISGIYEAMHKGAFDTPSDFEKITGRPHKSPKEMMEDFKNSH